MSQSHIYSSCSWSKFDKGKNRGFVGSVKYLIEGKGGSVISINSGIPIGCSLRISTTEIGEIRSGGNYVRDDRAISIGWITNCSIVDRKSTRLNSSHSQISY